ncbi:MAG: lipopolysaccharide biosynthesis protein [Chitinophagaceae bacterium]
MSTTRRVVSGSIASWLRIGITMLSQLILVPIYLTYWDVQTYAIWITVQALLTVISVFNQGHQTYLEFKFLKEGEKNKETISADLWSGLAAGALIGFSEIGLVLIFITTGIASELLGIASVRDQQIVHDGGLLLLIQISIWSTFTSLTGLIARSLSPFGYYSRMGWWQVWAGLVQTFVPVIAVTLGAGLLTTGMILALATVIGSIPQLIDISRLLKRIGINYSKPSFPRAFKNFTRSIVLSARSLLENFRQQGVRIVLSPLVGAAALVGFSTTRTAANIALQGLNTITNPLMPELMRFLNNRDQDKTEASFSTVWLIVLALLTPGFIILQYFIGPLFRIWTKGQVEFQPLLFAQLSFGVLVFAVAQPAMAVLRGNNLLRPQLLISLVAAVTAVGGMFILVPMFGINGAGTALLLAEIFATAGYRIVARDWLKENGLSWPVRSSRIVLGSVWLSALVMVALVYIHQYRWVVLLVGLALMFFCVRLYWNSLPRLAVSKVQSMASRLSFLKFKTNAATITK